MTFNSPVDLKIFLSQRILDLREVYRKKRELNAAYEKLEFIKETIILNTTLIHLVDYCWEGISSSVNFWPKI